MQKTDRQEYIFIVFEFGEGMGLRVVGAARSLDAAKRLTELHEDWHEHDQGWVAYTRYSTFHIRETPVSPL